MVTEKRGYSSLSEVERKFFPKAYEKRHSEQLAEDPDRAGKVLANKLVANLKN